MKQFVTRHYRKEDRRILSPVRLAVISDLHGAQYGEDQRELVGALDREAPHAVLLLGDIFDHRVIDPQARALVDALSGSFRAYFIPGNHEYRAGRRIAVDDLLQSCGIPLLAGRSAELSVGQTRIQLFGIEDGQGGKPKQARQLADAARQRTDEVFSILAIHAPQDAESHLRGGFDLMLSGHTHGGQIVIPGLLNGLYVPGQGLFPKYGGGRYDFGSQTLIISRGLSQKPRWMPRIGNPPELCFVTLSPAP